MANITRYRPFSDLVTMRDVMDRFWDDSIMSPLSWRQLDGEMLNPAVDVHQTGDEIIVTATLPGLKAEDVDITITGQTLTIRGEFKADDSVNRDQYLYRERRYGTFARQLQLPVRVQTDAATATFEDGVLTLQIPKAEEVKPRQVQVKAAPKRVEGSTK